MHIIESYRDPNQRHFLSHEPWLYIVENSRRENRRLQDCLVSATLGALAAGRIGPAFENAATALTDYEGMMLPIPPRLKRPFIAALGQNFQSNVTEYVDALEESQPNSDHEAIQNAKNARFARKTLNQNPIIYWVNANGQRSVAPITPNNVLKPALLTEGEGGFEDFSSEELAIARNTGATHRADFIRVVDLPTEPFPYLVDEAVNPQIGMVLGDAFYPMQTFER